VLEAALWGFVASGALLLGAAVAFGLRPSRRLVGLAMAFGAGALLAAVAYELVAEAFEEPGRVAWPALGFAAGALAFYAGDTLLDRRGADDRKAVDRPAAEGGSPLALVLGSVLDGVPESAVLGAVLVEGGGVSASFVVAAFLSNVPEGIAASTGLAAAGWRRGRVVALWLAVVGISTVTAALSWLAFSHLDGLDKAVLLAFAAGAVLVMLTDTMFPEAFRLGGREAGLATTLGFAVAFAISELI
jgi:ZIP family zinc transporter